MKVMYFVALEKNLKLKNSRTFSLQFLDFKTYFYKQPFVSCYSCEFMCGTIFIYFFYFCTMLPWMLLLVVNCMVNQRLNLKHWRCMPQAPPETNYFVLA